MSSHTNQTITSGLKVLAGQVGVNIISLGFGIYFAHVLALKEMAILAVLVLISGVFSVVTSLGMNDTLVKKIPRFIEEGKEDEANKYFISILCIQFVFAILMLCLSLVFYERISILFYKSVLPVSTMRIIILYSLMQSLMLLMNSMLRGVQRFGQLSTVKVIETISSRILSICLFFIWHVNGMLLGMLIGSLIGFLMYCYFLRGHIKLARPSIKLLREIIQYSLPYYGAAYLRFSVMHADKYFVGIFFQPEQLAVYHVANKIIGYSTQIIDAMASPIISKIAQLKVYGIDRMESIFSKVFKYYSLLYIPLIGFIIAFARPLLELYGGVKYTHGTQVLIILAAGLMLYPFSGMIETFVFIIGKPIERLKIRFYSGIFSLLGAFVLMKILGMNGLALSKLLTWGIYIFVGVMLLGKYIKVRIDKEILLKIAGSCLPVILGGVVIQFYFYNTYFVCLYVIIYVVTFFLFYFNVLKKASEISELLPKRLKRWAGIK